MAKSDASPSGSDHDNTRSSDDRPSNAAREAVRATGDVAGVVASLLLALYPDAELYRVGSGGATALERLILDPAPADDARLRTMLFELIERPEWRVKHTVTREVSDDDGERLEVITPLPAASYRDGARLVGPFATEEDAAAWGAEHAVSTLSYDTFFTGTAWLCDLFALPERS